MNNLTNEILIEEIAARKLMDAQDVQEEMNRDIEESAYYVLRSAEYACPQKYIRHVAQMIGVKWPPED